MRPVTTSRSGTAARDVPACQRSSSRRAVGRDPEQLGLRLRQRRPRREPRHAEHPVHVAPLRGLRVRGQGDEQLRRAERREVELWRQDADDRHRRTAERQRSADEARVRAEAALPQPVRQQHDVTAPVDLVLGRAEAPTE
jgi:hypothetical protein